jgi:hypothetical protein
MEKTLRWQMNRERQSHTMILDFSFGWEGIHLINWH